MSWLHQRYAKLVILKTRTNKVFSGELDGIGYIKTCCALPDSTESYEDWSGDNGTNFYVFGGVEQSRNLFPSAGSEWRFPSAGGIFMRDFMASCGKNYVGREGFRSSAYAD